MKKEKSSFRVPRPSQRVVVALRMAGIAGQDKLNGVFDFLSEGHRWQLVIYRTRHEFTAQIVEQELARGCSGFIVGIPETDEALNVLARTTVPTVVMDLSHRALERRKKNIAFVHNDPVETGRLAANTLLRQGVYKSYAFMGYRRDETWSVARGEGFRSEISRAGFEVNMFDHAHYPTKLEDKTTRINWLKALPKPCGVFASCDDCAFELLEACEEALVSVPAQVGILGVNNDPILCLNTVPQLSSLQPDFTGEGRLSARLLQGMMAHPTFSAPAHHLIKKHHIFLRGTTLAQSQAGKLVQRALNFINKKALTGIGVRDVVRAVGGSESLLQHKFRALLQESIYEAILRVRFEEVKRLLRTTSDPISAITLHCGWATATQPKILFKKRFGLSMRAYRKSTSYERAF